VKIRVMDAIAVDLADIEVGHHRADIGVWDMIRGAPDVGTA
jgi:hypothetical protein